ncbi:MAG TPA: type II CAAX endopeptidase family protein [Candidatus Saccharimonadales bacterium]|nr:type II CAAX endopeptidase family protein [Candidatus Saccharimonadales bacterium]
MYFQRILSVPWNIRQALAVFLVPWVLLPLAVVVWLKVLEPAFPTAQVWLQAYDAGDPVASFAIVLLDLAASYFIIGYYLRKYRVTLRSLGLRPFSFWRALWNVLLIMIFFSVLIGVVYTVLTFLSPGFNANQPQSNEFINVPSGLQPISLLALVIIPPLVEEPVFRGFMFPAFAKRFGLAGGAIISSLLFGFAHLQANVDVYTFILGLLLCFLYVRLGSIIPGIALHMLNNYIAYTAINK